MRAVVSHIRTKAVGFASALVRLHNRGPKSSLPVVKKMLFYFPILSPFFFLPLSFFCLAFLFLPSSFLPFFPFSLPSFLEHALDSTSLKEFYIITFIILKAIVHMMELYKSNYISEPFFLFLGHNNCILTLKLSSWVFQLFFLLGENSLLGLGVLVSVRNLGQISHPPSCCLEPYLWGTVVLQSSLISSLYSFQFGTVSLIMVHGFNAARINSARNPVG